MPAKLFELMKSMICPLLLRTPLTMLMSTGSRSRDVPAAGLPAAVGPATVAPAKASTCSYANAGLFVATWISGIGVGLAS